MEEVAWRLENFQTVYLPSGSLDLLLPPSEPSAPILLSLIHPTPATPGAFPSSNRPCSFQLPGPCSCCVLCLECFSLFSFSWVSCHSGLSWNVTSLERTSLLCRLKPTSLSVIPPSYTFFKTCTI